MMELVRTKIYLLNSDGIPSSFATFTEHAAQLDCYHSLWKEADITSHHMAVIKYPLEFRSDVEAALNELKNDYNNTLHG